jgi:tetratricopeptide (TPR) repeat protein
VIKFIARACVIVAQVTIAVTLLCGCAPRDKLAQKPPPPPGGVRLAISPGGLAVTWDAAPGATHYTLFWGKDRTEFSHSKDVSDCAGLITGLSKGEIYHVSVTAWNAFGESDYGKLNSIVYDDDPKHASRYLERGAAMLKQGRVEDAETYYGAAIRLAPSDPESYRRRAELYRLMNKPEEADRDSERARRVLEGKPINGAALGFGSS